MTCFPGITFGRISFPVLSVRRDLVPLFNAVGAHVVHVQHKEVLVGFIDVLNGLSLELLARGILAKGLRGDLKELVVLVAEHVDLVKEKVCNVIYDTIQGVQQGQICHETKAWQG